MTRAKITVTIEQDLAGYLADVARASRQSRSHLVEEAIRSWRRATLERDLIAGYRAMADEDRVAAEESLAATTESLT